MCVISGCDSVSTLSHIKKIRGSSPEVFCKKGVLRKFAKFTGKHPFQSLFCNKVAGLRPVNLLKTRLWRCCFPVNFAKFLRTAPENSSSYRTPVVTVSER